MFVIGVKDTTEEKAAQREASRQQALLAALIDSIPDPIFVKDLDGVYLRLQRGAWPAPRPHPGADARAHL